MDHSIALYKQVGTSKHIALHILFIIIVDLFCFISMAVYYNTLHFRSSSVFLPQSTPSIPIPSQSIPTPIPVQSSIRHRQPIPTAPASHSTAHSKSTASIHLVPRIQSEPPRKFNTAEIRNANSSARTRREQTVKESRLVYMPTIPRPARRERSTRIPPNAKAQRQRVTNGDLSIPSMTRNTIRRGRIDRAGTEFAIRSVDQQIQAVPDVQMTELQRAR